MGVDEKPKEGLYQTIWAGLKKDFFNFETFKDWLQFRKSYLGERLMKITEKLALDAFKNDKETHILLDQKICQPARNDSVSMPARQIFTPSTRKGDGRRICRLSRMRHLHDRLHLWLC